MVSAVKIKIIDEDASESGGKTKKATSSKNSKAKTSQKTLKKKRTVKPTSSKKKEIKKKNLSNKKEKNDDSVIAIQEDERDEKKEEVKNDIFANIDSVKRIIESEKEKEEEENILNKEGNNTIDGISGDEDNDLNFLEKEEKIIESNTKSLNLYKKIAYFFIALVLLLVVIVLYFSFVRVKIILIPNQEKVSNNMIFEIYDKENGNSSKGMIAGAIREESIESSSVFEPSGTEVIGKEAVGEVTIINNYSQNQPLVASTRMIPVNNPDKLFRLKETVNVPAGEEVKAEIYADEPSPDMAIKATRFTIPGLWAGLQDKIYAESSNDIVYRQKVKKYIVDSDFDNAKKDLRQKLLSEAKEKINEDYKEYGEIIYKIDENSIVSDFSNKTGDELDEFTGSIKADVIIVAFDSDKASDMAKKKFISSLSSNKELISFDDTNIIYALNNYNVSDGEATVNASFEGRTSIKENAKIIEVDKILGLKKDQLDTYLGDLSDIAGYEVKFYPSFLPDFLKKVPRLVDKVQIEIKK